jgi:16S rRNA (adenine1518-N6/adenine1519-N6)-dimethyltransferase
MTDISQLLKRHGIQANKSLGQNFLHKTDIIENIAKNAAGSDCVLEIGAGPGVLSKHLCGSFKKVVTIEIDRSLEPVTREVLEGCKNHTMVYADFLKINLNDIINKYLNLPPVTVVGNLPYNITGQIITKLIKNHALFDKAVIMIQKEAAQKLCAAPSQDGYRAISVLTQYFTNITPLFDVTPDCFIPAPHVTSSVILMKFKESLPLAAIHEGEFISFIHKIFCQRRKLITSVFQTPCEKDKLRRILNNLELSEKTRGEQLDHSQLSEIFRLLYMNKNEILGN